MSLSHFSPALASLALLLPAGAAPPSSPIVLDRFVVSAALDQAREDIVPSLGATSFILDHEQIANLPQGANAPFSQILLRAPGVAEDSSANGDLHVRGEHGNLQYRINDVLLPEGISGFGLELDPRFVDSLQLVTGSLPAQYGFRTAGIVDIHTKNGTGEPEGGFSLYGGSFNTLRPSFETGGGTGALSYFIDGSFDHNTLGIENPTSSARAVHDATDQAKVFAYLSLLLASDSRLSLMASGSDSRFQVPDTPGLPAGTAPDGTPWLPGRFDSSRLDERQTERNGYAVAAYQKSTGSGKFQLSGFGRASTVSFTPDPIGDLYFNGVASAIARRLNSAGLQGDGSLGRGEHHTLRGGFGLLDETVAADATTRVFPVDDAGTPDGPIESIVDHSHLHGLFAGLYLQDEWRLTPKVTINFGARADFFNASFDHEGQLSPRLNLIWQPGAATTLHAGYARYFTPPPVEAVSSGAVREFDGTSNASATDRDDPVKAERSDYFDAGISQQLAPGLRVGLDAYAKRATNQLDDGLFGQTLILSAFNYARGRVDGQELTASYARGRFSVYANLAHSVAQGREWTSAQFLFDPADLAYVKDHWISLDHDQQLTGSMGAAYVWKRASGTTRLYGDLIYGTGLRTDATAPDGSSIPNGGSVPAHLIGNLGVEQTFALAHGRSWKVRLDVVNVADVSYELRDGSGVGVNAAQYGRRRGWFASIGYAF